MESMGRSLLWVLSATCAIGLLSACGSNGTPQVLQESDAALGSLRVRVTLDSARRICTTTPNGRTDCLSAQSTPADGIQTAQLDALPGGPYLLRLLVSPGTQFTGLPIDQARMTVAMKTELVMAFYKAAPACFHMTDAQGRTHTVSVMATAVDSGPGVTAAAPAETSC